MRIKDQLRTLTPTLIAAYLPALAILGLAVAAKLFRGISIKFLTQDPATLMKAPFYVGAISNLGIVIWCVSASVYFFSFCIIRETRTDEGTREFFLASAIFSTVLLFDDLYLLHEKVFPRRLHIPENAVYLGYVVLWLLYFIRYGKAILRTDFLLLLITMGFFGLSVATDIIWSHGHYLLEDGSKFLGIIGWTVYAFRTCMQRFDGRW